MNVFRGIGPALLASILCAVASLAEARDTAALGGPRGAAFRIECGAGRVLSGLELGASSAIDAVTPLCAAVEAPDRLGETVALERLGGKGGKPQRVDCGPGKAVAALRVSLTRNKTVNAIAVTCRALDNASVAETRCIGTGEGCRGRLASCPASELATGLHGRASGSLDAIGLLCGPLPRPAAAHMTVAEEPAQEAPAAAKDGEEAIAGVEAAKPGSDAAFDVEPMTGGGGSSAADEAAPEAMAVPAPAASTAQPATRSAPLPQPEPVASAAPADDGEGKWTVVPVFFGTDRKPLQGTKRLEYGAERARKLELGRALVSVPTSHEAPNVERPWELTIPFFNVKLYEEKEDPAKHFTMREMRQLTEAELLQLVAERLKASKAYKDQALIFVHGFNVTFDNAVFRTAQMAHDLKFDGAPFLYSWPSKGDLLSYTYDRSSNEQAEPYLKQFVELVVKKSGAKAVSVIAHSMGNQITLRVLKDLKAAAPKVVINQIILAAPDVDRDSFENIARELKGLAKGITLYAASNDRALEVSKTFNGGIPRAGDVPKEGPVVVEGVDTIDVTALSTDSLGLNHSTYATKNALLTDIGMLLRDATLRPDKREPKLTKIPLGSLEFWRYPAQ